MKIVFENAQFIAVDKESGWLTTPSRLGEQDKRRCLGSTLQKQLGVQIYPVHRLDFEVSGLVLFAKSADAHRIANKVFENRAVKKTYEALTEGAAPDQKEFTWKNKILRGKKRAYVHEVGKLALTQAHSLGEKNGKWHWRLEPETGRPHQLRFHLFQNHFPIWGDFLYGAKEAYQTDAIALKATELDFSAAPEMLKLDLPKKIQVEGF